MEDRKRTKNVTLTDLKTLVNTTYTLTSEVVTSPSNYADVKLTDNDATVSSVRINAGTGMSITQPSANNITLASLNDDANFVFTQGVPSATWNITHNLGKFCSVTVVDTSKQIVIGDITYTNNNSLTITFSAPFSGEAFLN
tara:strand:- start:5154 stop:5576 length:423 start_codon:yes stop_codon:yes gene_type:complete